MNWEELQQDEMEEVADPAMELEHKEPYDGEEIRDERGRIVKPSNKPRSGAFKPGYDPRRTGRRPRKVEEAYVDALYEEIDLDEWRRIVRVHADKALDGDHRAFAKLMEQILGKPKQRVEVSTTQDDALLMLQGLLQQNGVQLNHIAEAVIVQQPAQIEEKDEVVDGIATI